MTCLGTFNGAELYKLNYKQGDVVLFRPSVLEHFVAKADAPRSLFVLFSHTSAATLKQPKEHAMMDYFAQRQADISLCPSNRSMVQFSDQSTKFLLFAFFLSFFVVVTKTSFRSSTDACSC